MRNIDISNWTKAELIKGIIRLTNTTNRLIKSRDGIGLYTCPAESTLRTKKLDFIEEKFKRAWDSLCLEIRTNHDEIDVNIDKQALNDFNAGIQKEYEKNYNEYSAYVDMCTAEITELIHNLIRNCNILNMFTDIAIEDIIIGPVTDDCVHIRMNNCFGGEMYYYHPHTPAHMVDDGTKKIDEINFGTIGPFDLDSLRGHQQLVMMNLSSHIGGNQEIRAKINGILEDINNRNIIRLDRNRDIRHSYTEGVEEIVAPYINSVAMGEAE